MWWVDDGTVFNAKTPSHPRQQQQHDKAQQHSAACPFFILRYFPRSLGGQIRSPPSLEIVQGEGAVDAVASPVELRERFSQALFRDFHAESFQQVAQLVRVRRAWTDRSIDPSRKKRERAKECMLF